MRLTEQTNPREVKTLIQDIEHGLLCLYSDKPFLSFPEIYKKVGRLHYLLGGQ